MIPFSYNEDRCFFFPVDPWRAYAYWDYSAATWERLRSDSARLVVMLQREGETRYEIELPPESKSFYFNDLTPRANYRVLLTIRRPYGLEGLMQSQPIVMPPDSPSPINDPRFATFQFLTRRLRRRLDAEGHRVGRGYEAEGGRTLMVQPQGGVEPNVWTSWPQESGTPEGGPSARDTLFGLSSLALPGRPAVGGAPDGAVPWLHREEEGKEGRHV